MRSYRCACFFFSSRRRHTRSDRDWSSDVCSSDLRPGGTVAVFDGDFASWSWSHPDPALAVAMNEALIATVVANPLLMRQMPRLLRDLGLRLLAAQPNLYAEVGTGHFFAGAAESYGPLVAAAGALPAQDVERWLAGHRRAVAEGTFFASCNSYAYVAERPAGD